MAQKRYTYVMANQRPFRRKSGPSETREVTLTDVSNSPQKLPQFRRSSDGFSRQELVNAFRNSFQMIGGVDALTIWAADNQTEFYKLFSKLFPAATLSLDAQTALIIQHAVPPTLLDNHPSERIDLPIPSEGEVHDDNH